MKSEWWSVVSIYSPFSCMWDMLTARGMCRLDKKTFRTWRLSKSICMLSHWRKLWLNPCNCRGQSWDEWEQVTGGRFWPNIGKNYLSTIQVLWRQNRLQHELGNSSHWSAQTGDGWPSSWGLEKFKAEGLVNIHSYNCDKKVACLVGYLGGLDWLRPIPPIAL